MAEEVEQATGKKKSVIVALVALAALLVVAVLAYSVLPNLQAGAAYELTPTEESDLGLSEGLLSCSVEDSGGATVVLGDLSKASQKPIVMNIWASWCTHCIEEMEAYQKLYDEYGDRIEFVMLNVVDTPGEAQKARDFVKEHSFTYPVYYDSNAEVREALFVTGIPVSVIVSADGKVVMNRAGEIDYNTMKATLERIL
ncbi:MAG: TlpA family protein disulfide reductase [Eggerthellaceae bacterium]|nr:TlpA family protein disulfide reductase [Eggerthellaceae bacterium]